MRLAVSFWFTLVLLLLGEAACSTAPNPASTASSAPAAASASAPPPLAFVSRVAEHPLPPWIGVAPHGGAIATSQIRIRFRDDVIPLESLEAPERQAALAHVAIEPALPGRFLFLTPRMIGFQADAPLPPATRVRITLTKGLADLHGHTLDQDLAWTFETDGLSLSTNLSDSDQNAVPGTLNPEIVVTANAELDTSSLGTHARLIAVDDANVTAQLELKAAGTATASPAPPDQAAGQDQTPGFSYTLVPSAPLAKARHYRLEIEPGVLPLRGNLPSADRVVGFLATYAPLRLLHVDTFGEPDQSGASGRFAGGAPRLVFNNGLVANTAAQAISIQHPAPAAGAALVNISDGDSSVVLNPHALSPNTTYSIAIGTGLTDVFGQTLSTPQTVAFTTTDLAGDLWAPTGFNVFPAASDLVLNVESTNLIGGHYRAGYRVLAPEDLIFADPGQSAETLLPARESWSTVAAPRRNRAVTTHVPLRERLGSKTGMLVYGITAQTNEVPHANNESPFAEPLFAGAVQLTNIGVFAQWFPDAGIVRTHRLSDGAPLAGAHITIYPSRLNIKERSATEPCAGGVTGPDGTLRLDGPAFAPCSVVSTRANEAPSLLVIARTADDWAFVRTLDYSGMWDYGVPLGWSAGAPQAHGAIVSDRDLYQPGETAFFTGIAYFDTNGVLAKGRAPEYHLTLASPSGSKHDLGTVALDPYGAFTVRIPLERRQELGYYTLLAHAANGEELDGSFRVAQFKPPNFKVALALDRPFAVAGEPVTASWQSSYLFGGVVEGGKAHVDVTRSRAYFVPNGWEQFWFGRTWSYPETEPTVASDVLQADSTIGADGKSTQAVTVADDLPYPMTYEVDAQTTDVSNLSVSDTKTFTALPSDALIGLQSDFVATTHQPHDISVIVTNAQGKPLTDRHVHVVLQRRSFGSATQLVVGGETPVDSVHYTDVAQADVAPGSQPQKIALTPTDAGDYRIRANFVGATSDVTATDADLWVSGPGSFDWGRGNNTTVSVKLDKAKYRPGETARVLVQSPYPQAELRLAVVRHGVMWQKTLLVSGPAPQVAFPITAEMLPNAAVEAVLVRRGAPLERATTTTPDSLARIGFASFEVAIDTKYLKIVLSPEHQRVEPQQVQRVRVHVTDTAGHGVRTELALAVVNDAILQLNGYRFPDLAQIVYADQPISTRLADSRADVALVSMARPQEKGFGYGGGFEHGAAGTRVRTQFKPIAFYDGTIKTDAAGNATVAFPVPDDLTTWRVMALAFSPDARFGVADTTFLATTPLVTNAVLPQFARPGDEFRGGLTITNPQGIKGDVHIAGTLGGDLAFVDAAGLSPTTSLQAPIDQITQAFRFNMRVTGSKPVTIAFATGLGDRHDAFREALDVVTNRTTESVVEVGATAHRAAIPLNIDPQTPGDTGGLDVTLASTLLPQTREAVRATLADDAPFATAIASRIMVAADAILLDRRYRQVSDAPALSATLERNLSALRELQLSDGGYADWPGGRRAEIYSTAFCAVSLARARAAGAAVSADIAGVRGFLLSRLANPDPDSGPKAPARSEVRLEALETLASLGELRDDHLSDILASHQIFSFYEQVELARQLLRLPAWHAAGMTLRDHLFQEVYLTGRFAAVNVPDSSLETATAGQAQMVGLLIDSHAAVEDIDRAFRSLLGLRRNGVWPCPCDNAEAMDAAVTYAALQPSPPDFTAQAVIGGSVMRAQFRGYEMSAVTQTFPMAKLPRPRTTVALEKSGTGTLHYAVAYRYGLRGEQPGVYAGIRLERILCAVADQHELARFGLLQPSAAPTVDAARVFEIEDRITTDHPIDEVIVTDPLPAGLEAVDTAFLTSTRAFAPGVDNWQIDYQQIYRDHVIAFAQHLEAGVYSVHYLVRSVTPGTYAWPAADVHPAYAPEDFGRTAAGRLRVR